MSSGSHAQQRDKLQIRHLILWTAATSVVVAIRLAWTDWDSFPSELLLFVRLSHVFVSLVTGAALAAMLEVGWRWWRGDLRFANSPGLWLLSYSGISTLIGGAATVISAMSAWLRGVHPNSFFEWNMNQLMLFGGVFIMSAVFVRLIRFGVEWTIFFASALFASGLFSLIHLLVLTSPWNLIAALWGWYRIANIAGTVAFVAMLMTICLIDYRRSPSRDWLHWFGVLVFTSLTAWYGMWWAWM